LATCYGIVKQSGGHIVVSSELGHGATFTVYLPRGEELPSPAPSPAPAPSVRSGERVLLVEDEPSVRAVAERALSRHGYQVFSAATAEEAVRLASSAAPFVLLVTDLVLPGMSG